MLKIVARSGVSQEKTVQFVLGSMGPITLNYWHLEAQDDLEGPGDPVELRIVGETADGRRIVTAPVVRRLPRRLVLTEAGLYHLGRPHQRFTD